MNAQSFFDIITPSEGLRCIVLPRPDGKWHHIWRETSAELAQVALACDAQGETVYFGVLSFRPDGFRNGKPRSFRRHTHAHAARSFIIDLDVFDPRDPEPSPRPEYPDRRAAAQALGRFCRELGLPRPWVTGSGVGLHAYFVMDGDMPADVWKMISDALKAALIAKNILFDPSRTADMSSVLRPVGTTHRKFAPLPVTLLQQGDISDLTTFSTPLLPWVNTAPARPAVSGNVTGPASAAFGGGMAYEPSSADQMADLCGVVGEMRSTLGKLDYPTWFHAIGALAFTEEAPGVCHDWSVGDHRYDPKQVDQKIADWQAKSAVTCKAMAGVRPDICAACPFNGKITTPVELGRGRYAPAPQQPAQPQAAAGGGGKGAFGGGTTAAGPAGPGGGSTGPSGVPMPRDFREAVHQGRRMIEGFVKATDKKPEQWVVICETFFWATRRLDNNGILVEWVREEHDGSHVVFEMSGRTIAKGGNDALGELGHNSITAATGRRDMLVNYLNRWMDRVSQQPVVETHQSFGWARNESFVTGELTYAPDGSSIPTIAVGNAVDRQRGMIPRGDPNVWKALIDRAYNAPGQEAYQFQLMCGFAAPLLTLMQVKGLTVYAHSAGSGVGKTTVQKAALSIWGDGDDMMLAQGKATMNALWGWLGIYGTLPVVYDELTNASNDEASSLVFSVSSGRAKKRMTNGGDLSTNNSNWSTILLASGNTLLSDKLAAHRHNAEAEISRLFEFTQPSSTHLKLAEANDLFPKLDLHYGHAGPQFAAYLAVNRDHVIERLEIARKLLEQKFKIRSVERYWLSLFTVVLVAMEIARKLELVQFEIGPVVRWMHERLADNRQQRREAVVTDEDNIAQMLRDMGPGMLVTLGRGTRGNKAEIVNQPHGVIVARMVQPFGRMPDHQLWVSRPEVNRWCIGKGLRGGDLFDAAVKLGWAAAAFQQIDLGVGTNLATNAPVWCWRLFPDRMPGAIPGGLTVHQGGASLNQGLTGGTP